MLVDTSEIGLEESFAAVRARRSASSAASSGGKREKADRAKSAGFCFGVSRSVEMAEKLLEENGSCASLGRADPQ